MKEHRNDDVLPSAWLLVWTIYVVKFVMIFIIFWSSRSFEPAALVAATTWGWLGPALAIAASPAAFRMRLRKVRRRRAALLRSEWIVDEPAPVAGRR
jgi:hypothetical protein